ncbi:type IV pilus modification protein PilV [Ramlibacter sp. USB13]|uniref:Type IV pilus modification protein PilV n=1 Tax=Ramlibacter cellulosilyticus TaxID=2764187 RepID=A0A923S9H2_9BURK|nr:type IV pilus modification protein PilV [Ramlibacter cellulosilyticus]MBC5781660.1 type IV pilus modification protein PilV [Ramlibacter cellulosilyticus]
MSKASAQGGFTLLETLVAMLIVAFGVLGYVGLQARTVVSTLEGYQRAQALVLVADIAQRINLNRHSAAAYVADDVGVDDPGACPATPVATRDLCQWAHLLRGAAEQQDGNKVGAITAARGCIASLGGDQYMVSVVWQGVQATGPTPLACGTGEYADENLRRGVSTVIRIANLTAS